MQANDYTLKTEEREAEEVLQELLLEGVQSSEPEEMNHGEWDEIRRQALRQFEARKSTKAA